MTEEQVYAFLARPVLKNLASGFSEVAEKWTLDDLAAMHGILDQMDHAEQMHMKEIQAQRGSRR